MLDGYAEPGGRPRRVRTVSVRLAAGGATARSISPSLARAGARLAGSGGCLSPQRPTAAALARERYLSVPDESKHNVNE